MMTKQQLENIMEEYLSGNIRLRREKAEVLKQFQDIEQAFRNFELKLSSLEQKFHELKLKNYETLTNKILGLILDFDTYNINANIQKLENIQNALQQIESFIQDSNKQIAETEAIWKIFKKNNTFLQNKNIVNAIEEELNKIDESVKRADYGDIRSLTYTIKKLKENVKRYIKLVENMRTYYQHRFFVGDEAEIVHKKIEELFIDKKDMPVGDFIKEVEALNEKIKRIEESNVFLTIPVPVVKMKKTNSNDVYEFALKFGDYILDFTNFADGGKEDIIYEDTGEMMFFQHIPYSGIFNLEDVFDLSVPTIFDPGVNLEKKANFDEKYIQSLEMYHKKIYNFFMAFMVIGLTSSAITAFMPLGAILANAAAVIGGTFWYMKYAKTILKTDVEKVFGRKRFFLFPQTNLLVFKVGEDLDPSGIGETFLANIDRTVKNKKYREWFEKEGKQYV